MSKIDLNVKDLIDRKNERIATLEAKLEELQESNQVLAQLALKKNILKEGPPGEPNLGVI